MLHGVAYIACLDDMLDLGKGVCASGEQWYIYIYIYV
jgi:hypothetical protein